HRRRNSANHIEAGLASLRTIFTDAGGLHAYRIARTGRATLVRRIAASAGRVSQITCGQREQRIPSPAFLDLFGCPGGTPCRKTFTLAAQPAYHARKGGFAPS